METTMTDDQARRFAEWQDGLTVEKMVDFSYKALSIHS